MPAVRRARAAAKRVASSRVAKAPGSLVKAAKPLATATKAKASQIVRELERKMELDPLAFMENMRAEQGTAARLSLGVRDIHLFTDPADVHAVLVAKNGSFRGLQLARPLLDDGILSVDGDQHRKQRKLLTPAFHHRRIQAYGAIAADLAGSFAGRWQDGQRLDMAEEMLQLTLDVTGQILLGRDHATEAADIGEALTKALEAFRSSPLAPWTSRLPTPVGVRFARGRARVDALVEAVLEKRTGPTEGRDDLLSMLLEARWDDGTGMTRKQVRDELVTLFVAGHETTALSLTWAWHCLAQNPEVQARVQREVDEVVGDRAPGVEDVPRLRYTRQALTETLRLYPPVWSIGRKATEKIVIGGTPVDKGDYVIVSPYLTHREATWWPEPERFDPDRFDPDRDDGERPKYAYFPFGGGTRVCLGEQLAWMEAILIVAALAQRWTVTPVENAPVVRQPLLTLQPRGGLHVTVAARKRPSAVRRA